MDKIDIKNVILALVAVILFSFVGYLAYLIVTEDADKKEDVDKEDDVDKEGDVEPTPEPSSEPTPEAEPEPDDDFPSINPFENEEQNCDNIRNKYRPYTSAKNCEDINNKETNKKHAYTKCGDEGRYIEGDDDNIFLCKWTMQEGCIISNELTNCSGGDGGGGGDATGDD